MSSFDDFKREETPVLADGDYRVEIISAEERVSQAGNPMIVLSVRPNGSNIKISHYIVKNQWFNKNATQLFDSFNIECGDFNLMTWVGAVGAAHIVKDDSGYMKIKWFICKDKQEALPAWVGNMPERQSVTAGFSESAGVGEDEVPF